MKKHHFLILLFALAISFAQAQDKVENIKNLQAYMLSGETLTLKVGEKARLSMSINAIAGVTADVYSKDNKIVKFVESRTKYKKGAYPEAKEEKLYKDKETGKWVKINSKPDFSKGGKARTTYFFEASKVGETIIYAEEKIKGAIKNKHIIKVKVIEK